MSTTYDIGDRPTLTATFYNSAGDLADPTAITFKLRAPDGTVTTANETDATNDSIGVWSWQIPAAFDTAGGWVFRAEATAGLQTAEETSVLVAVSSF